MTVSDTKTGCAAPHVLVWMLAAVLLFVSPATAAALQLSIAGEIIKRGTETRFRVYAGEEMELSDAHIIMKFNPPIYVAPPEVKLSGGNDGITLSLSALAPGVYVINVAARGRSIEVKEGLLFEIAGITRSDLSTGKIVQVSVSGDARDWSGNPVIFDGAAMKAPMEDVSVARKLTLRLSDVKDVQSGETITMEVRTYRPTPIADGQVCLVFDAAVFSAVGTVTVLGSSTDVSYTLDSTLNGETIISFSSPSASINRRDGPMLQIELTLAANLPSGQVTTVSIDTDRSYMIDDQGIELTLASVAGVVAIGP